LTSIRDLRNTPALPNRQRWDTKPAARDSERERKKRKQPQQGQPQERMRRVTESKTPDVAETRQRKKKEGERMKERQRQRQIERKEEVLFRCTDTKHIFGSSLFLFFFYRSFSFLRCVLHFAFFSQLLRRFVFAICCL